MGAGPGYLMAILTSRPGPDGQERDTNRTRETEINGFPNFLHSYP